jgi:glycerol kinase
MDDKFILAIDQGTTGSTALVVDFSGAEAVVLSRSTVDFAQHFPRAGWVEHDLKEIWDSLAMATTRALDAAGTSNTAFNPSRIAAIGITNQRETLCAYDRKSCAPLTRAIVWQCRRTTDICGRLKEEGLEATFRDQTGLVLDPYFSGTKMTWLMENEVQVRDAITEGRGVFGTIDTFLVSRLTGGNAFVTEPSNASRTLVFDIEKGVFSATLADALGLPNTECLAEVRDSAGSFGVTKDVGFLPDGIPITGILGDQQAALAGQTCFSKGEAKCTFGTGAFLLVNQGDHKLASHAGLLTTVAWSLEGLYTYAFEGSSFIAGAALQFLRDQLELLDSAPESETMASAAAAAPEVYYVPALAGLGAPYWDPAARGAFLGLTRGTSREQLVRAALEGMAFQVCDLIASMEKDLSEPMTVLRVDGGAAANNLLMQIQADYSGLPVDRPENLETTAFGAALFAALGCGIYSGLDELRGIRRSERIFNPGSISAAEVTAAKTGWKRAVEAVQLFGRS